MSRRNIALATTLAGALTALLATIGLKNRRNRIRVFRPLENDPVFIQSAGHSSYVALDVKCQIPRDYEFEPTEDEERMIAMAARQTIEILKDDIADSFEIGGKLKHHVAERANGEIRRKLVDLNPDRRLIFSADIRQIAA